MAESTLSITFAEIKDQLGHYLGYTRTEGDWDSDQAATVAAIVKSGLRQFYRAHEWSFLRPLGMIDIKADTTATVTDPAGLLYGGDHALETTVLVDEAGTFTADMAAVPLGVQANGVEPSYFVNIYFSILEENYPIEHYVDGTQATVEGDLQTPGTLQLGEEITISYKGNALCPDDFGGVLGKVHMSDGDFLSGQTWTLPVTSFSRIKDEQRADMDQSGIPQYCWFRPLATDGSAGQRYAVQVFPYPNADYRLRFRYNVLPNMLVTTTNEYPYGGMYHGEAILASILAVAENRINDADGEKRAEYQRCLLQSIELDTKLNAPEHFGYNADRSDARRRGAGATRRAHYSDYRFTYNDTEY